MLRSHQHSSPANSRGAGADSQALPVVLEFLSPAVAVAATPIPRVARGLIWVVGSMFAVWVAALGLIQIDRVVTTHGRVVSKGSTIVVQPLDTAIVRSIDVREGQQVRSGELLARLDPTFATADVDSLQAQVSSLQAEASRLRAEVEERPFAYIGLDADLSLQAAIFARRGSERTSRLESYSQKIDGLKSA